MLTLIGVLGQIKPFLRLLTKDNITFMSKAVRKWLKNCVSFQYSLLDTECGVFFENISKCLIV